MSLNFDQIRELHQQKGSDRNAIAAALGLTPQQIDELQRECLRIARQLDDDSEAREMTVGGHENISG
jgi:hypothetical protein